MSYMVIVSEWGVERDARREVRQAGFTTYQPQTRDRVLKYGRKIWVERLLLGRYFFAKWQDGCDWKALFKLRRVNGLFMRVDANLPSLIADAEIERIRGCEDKSGFVVTGKAGNGLHKGQRVYATTGIMIGLVGEYVGAGRGGCDVAMLELFGQPSRVEFRPGVLAAA